MASINSGRIFIGHGHSNTWRELKDFLQDHLKLDWDEFDRESAAGLTTKERLLQMLDGACFAFLVMTAEDEHGDGSKHARGNVIHEVGLFQGRLGFEKAIVLLEEGCAEFSNIVGLIQIRFPKGNISAKFEEIRRVLEREDIPGDGELLADNASHKQRMAENGADGGRISLTNAEIRYLMQLSRPRNQQGVPIGFFDHFANRESANYQAMVDKFLDLGLMRVGGSAYQITPLGYKAADRLWRTFVLNAVKTHQGGQWDYVPTDIIATAVLLTEGEAESMDLQRHLSALEGLGFIEPVRADFGVAAARITSEGHAELRPYGDVDFTPVD